MPNQWLRSSPKTIQRILYSTSIGWPPFAPLVNWTTTPPQKLLSIWIPQLLRS
jgi:hypothetical protein